MKTKKILILTLIMAFLMTTFSNIAFAATPEKTFTGYIDVSDKSSKLFAQESTWAVPFYWDNELVSQNGKYIMKLYDGKLIIQNKQSGEITWSRTNGNGRVGLVLFCNWGLIGLSYSYPLERMIGPTDYFYNYKAWTILPGGNKIKYLYLQNDGNFVMYSSDWKVIWKSKEYTKNSSLTSTKKMNTTAYIDAFGNVYSSTTMWASGVSGFKGKIKLEVLDSNNAVIGSKTFGAYGVSGFSKRNVDCNFSIDASKAGQAASIRITHYK